MSKPNPLFERVFGPDLERATEEAVKEFLESEWDDYMVLVRKLANHPENRPGADKTWVEDLLEMNRLHYRNTVRVR